MSKSPDFFISYNHADKDMARWIAWELQKADYRCVIQDRDFAPGQNFMSLMRQALNNTSHMIAVLSPEYFTSAYTNLELDAALVNDPKATSGKLIPVRVQECELDPIMRGRIYIDLVNVGELEARRRLLAGVRAALVTVTEPEMIKFDSVPEFLPRSKPKTGTPTAKTESKTARQGKPKLVYVGLDVGTGLDLRGQFRQISAAIKAGKDKAPLTVRSYFGLTADDLPTMLNKELPAIVHLAGNQDGGQVLIRDRNGGVTTIPDVAVAGLLQSLDGAVKLAIVDTCNSYRCARQVVNGVDLAIGVKGKIFEDDAIAFYNIFYKALASRRSVAAAIGQATAALRFKRVPNNKIPELCVKRGVDSNSVHFSP